MAEQDTVVVEAPKTFNDLRNTTSVWEEKPEATVAEEPEKPGEPTEPEKPAEEPATPPGEKPETKEPEKPAEEKPKEEPTDTQVVDGYVQKVSLEGKEVPIDELFNDVEVDLYLPNETRTVKGLEELRVLAQKGAYSDVKNAESNRRLAEAQQIKSTFQAEVSKTAQTVAQKYLQNVFEQYLAGPGQTDPNNPIAHIAAQDPDKAASLVANWNQSQAAQLQSRMDALEKEKLDLVRQQQEAEDQRTRDQSAAEIISSYLFPYQQKFDSEDDWTVFRDTVGNVVSSRITEENFRRKSENPSYTGMSKDELAHWMRETAKQVFLRDQERINKEVDKRMKPLKAPAQAGPVKGGGAPIESSKPKPKGKLTWDTLRVQV